MLLTLVPLFDENMAVCAYSFFTQRENFLLNPLLLGTAQFDGASQITGLELIQKMGIDTLSQGKKSSYRSAISRFLRIFRSSAMHLMKKSYF